MKHDQFPSVRNAQPATQATTALPYAASEALRDAASRAVADCPDNAFERSKRIEAAIKRVKTQYPQFFREEPQT